MTSGNFAACITFFLIPGTFSLPGRFTIMTATKNPKRKKSAVGSEEITAAYKKLVLTQGQPTSVFAFCDQMGIGEGDFYKHFGSFESVEKSIWTDYITETLNGLNADKAYADFTAREKILTFYFGLAEVLKNDRSFVLYQLSRQTVQISIPVFLRGFKQSFDHWVKAVIASGEASGEIAKRPYVSERYYMVFWLHFMFILQFWQHDDSAGFEKTDEAIEKSVNLAFDLISKGILDNAVDFGKFLYQTAKN